MAHELKGISSFSRNPAIVFREEGDEALLFNPQTGSIRVLNPTGVYLWQLLDGKKSFASLLELMVNEYEGVSSDVLERHLKAFLSRLKKYNLICSNEGI